MSRREQKGPYGIIAYGVDHAVGLFVQVWGNPVYHKTTKGDDPDIDLDKLSHPDLTMERVIHIADMEAGVQLTPADFTDL